MKRVFLLFLVPLCLGLMGMESCFPGDGYDNPDDFGVSGHGPALSYKDNGDGTFTDNVTKWMWEKKLKADGSEGGNCDAASEVARGVNCVNKNFRWSATLPDPDGTLFMVFLDALNNKCDGDKTTSCTSDADCFGIGNGLCGHAGFRDWCIPNVKKLQSIVDYTMFSPASSFPGETGPADTWSATTLAFITNSALFVSFGNVGDVDQKGKDRLALARAVRPCS